MRVVGLDLAGVEKNATGFCFLEDSSGKTVTTSLVHNDGEILSGIDGVSPDIVAVDAPLDYAGVERVCDRSLRQYGVLPATMPGMRTLAGRGTLLAKKIRDAGFDCIEVSVRASSRILGIDGREDFTVQKRLLGLDLGGDISSRILTRDELDAVCCALTGYLYVMGDTETIEGQVVLPRV